MTRRMVLHVLALCLALCCWQPAARAQEAPKESLPINPEEDLWDGIDGFTQLLTARGIDLMAPDKRHRGFMVGDFLAKADVGDCAVLLLGRAPEDVFTVGALNEFVLKGGNLFVASDSATMNDVLLRVPVYLNGTFATTQFASQGFKRYPDCPVLVPMAPFSRTLFHGEVRRIITNKAVSILSYPDHFDVLVRLPRQRWGAPEMPFCVAGVHGKGRAMVLGDHSVFINQLIVEGNNWEFAEHLFDWLDGATQLKQAVLILDGKLIGYDPEKKSPIPFEPRFDPFSVENINRTLYALDRKTDALNDWARGKSRVASSWSWLLDKYFDACMFAGLALMLGVLFIRVSKPAPLAGGRRASGVDRRLAAQLLDWARARRTTAPPDGIVIDSAWLPGGVWILSGAARDRLDLCRKALREIESAASEGPGLPASKLPDFVKTCAVIRDEIADGRLSFRAPAGQALKEER